MRAGAAREGQGGFAAALRQRFQAVHALKLVGTVAFIAVFFAGYFILLRHPFFTPTVMAAGPLDRAIPYQSWATPAYFTLWFYVSLAPALLPGRAAILRYGAVAGGLAALAFAIFALWPTRVVLEGAGFLKRVDPGGNAFPSLHAAYAVLTAVALGRILAGLQAPIVWRAANAAWCAVILYSTLATKQHVFSDVAGGAALGLIAAQFLSSSKLNAPG